MGKQTRFHPVSLNVIRGAAEFHGWKLGKIRQTRLDPNHNQAEYVALVEEMPEDLLGLADFMLTPKFNQCFSDDIACTAIWHTKSGQMKVAFVTFLLPEEEAS